MDRRAALRSLALAVGGGLVSAARGVAAGRRPPDVLFIAIDDLNDWLTLFDRANPIRTPNLERLAARGMFFTRAYCAAAACAPSRAAVMTGLMPATSGVYGNEDAWALKVPDAVTLPRHFLRHGYATRGAGKIFHHGPSGADPPGRPSFETFLAMVPARKDGPNVNGYTDGLLSRTTYDWGVHEQKMTDLDTVEWCERVLEQRQHAPLFLAAGIFKPHLPFYAPPETFRRYPLDELELPPSPSDDLEDVPPIGRELARTESFVCREARARPREDPGSLERMVQAYQASADFADQMVGRLIDKLDETGRADRTLIVLWSDHGYHLGDKQSCVKFTLWEKATHVPFIIVAPGKIAPGVRCERTVSLVDVYPTLLELAGLPARPGLDGRSLLPLLRDPNRAWPPAVMTMGRGNHSVRSERWRYIRYRDGTEELYDHERDPWEWTNLASDRGLADVVDEHRRWLPRDAA